MGTSEQRLTLGLPRIRNETGEVRDFLPVLARDAVEMGAEVWIETGYGSGMGHRDEDYLSSSSHIHAAGREAAFACEIVLMLRPSDDALDLLRSGTTFVSMLHFPTHTERVRQLKELGIEAVGLDLIVDDEGERLVENMKAVAWNGLDTAFALVERIRPDFAFIDRAPTRVTIVGAGMVGKHAVEAATKFGSLKRSNLYRERGGSSGVEVTTVGRNLSRNETYMRHRLISTDVLVDATRRSDPSQPVIPNAWLGWLPEKAVIVDLSVDPYLLEESPPVVRGVEGVPKGDLDQYVFSPDDPAWKLLPPSVPVLNRRWVVSCYAWPGIFPIECMERYGHQIEPLLHELVHRGGARFLRSDGGYFERALQRASLTQWIDKI